MQTIGETRVPAALEAALEKRKRNSEEAALESGQVDLKDCVRPGCGGGLRNSLLGKSCQQMHQRIPKEYLLQWISNLKAYLVELSGDDGHELPVGCSCSGTGIWGRVNELLLMHWQDEFNVSSSYTWSHRFMCELEPKKQALRNTAQHTLHNTNAIISAKSKVGMCVHRR